MEGFYPLFFNLRGRNCLVLGGGKVALRKVKILLSCRAHIFLISSHLLPELVALKEKKSITHLDDHYSKSYLQDISLVVSATSDKDLNCQVAEDCFNLDIPVNTVDDPSLCSFFFPAVVDRGTLKLGISTCGKSPAFARYLREKLENIVEEEWGDFVDFLGQIRPWIIKEIENPYLRSKFFNELASSEFLEIFRSQGVEELNRKIEEMLPRFKNK